LKILLFNNRIYGLTKGQYSPTSEIGKVTKSTPVGSVDFPFNPITIALGAHATFVARSIDVEQKHLGPTLKRAHDHRGASFVEILQNCNIFNDGAFNDVSDKAIKAEHQLILEHGKPLIFGKNRDKGIRMNGMRPEVVNLGTDGKDLDSLVVHDETNLALAFMLGNFEAPLPVPIGVFYSTSRPTYDSAMNKQITDAMAKGKGDPQKLLNGGDTWTVN
jgi:2-oxoglutarate/2-oxoacid ferredoxin oxidoreductase subunit beta